MRQKPVAIITITVANPIRNKIKYKVGALEESVSDEREDRLFPQGSAGRWQCLFLASCQIHGFGPWDFRKIVRRGCTMTVSYPEFRSATFDKTRPLPVVATVDHTGPARRSGLYRNLLKRAFDMAAVTLALPVVAPLILGMAAIVRRDGGPAFYTQVRVGKDGRHFRMWKLRSMVPDADTRFSAYLDANPEARREWDRTQKLKRDPRITSVGAFLRRSSLDELPQLWNVLIGDMSLVGPRPIMLNQQALYPGQSYFALRPGITGHWQTAGRNATSFAARADYDTAYDADLSLTTDLRILGRTVSVVMRCTGY